MRARTVAVVAAFVCGLTSVAGVPAYAADPPPIAEEGESQYALTGEPLGLQQLRTAQQQTLASVPTPRTPRFGPSIDGYAPNDPQDTCQSGERPGPVALRALLNDTYDLNRTGNITRGCDVGGTSEHKEGRALDYMLDSTDAHERDIADTVVDWMLATDQYGNKHAMARRLGIMYIIWNRRIWSAARASEGWRSYSGDNPHTDHVHFSFGWPGARKETTWWTAGRTSASADFNGDGTSDIGVYRVNAGQWHVLNLRNREQIIASYSYGGNGSDIPLSGDFDGDGYADIALYRRSEGQWHIKSVHRNVQIAGSLPYGGDPSDVPVVGDFNGDGFDDIGVYRVTAGQWHVLNLRNREQIIASYSYGGDPSDIPLTGDFDGDGYDDIALYRKNAGQWHIKSVHRNVQIAGSLPYGGDPSDRPVVGDLNGDGTTDIGVYRVNAGQWHVLNLRNREQIIASYEYGGNGSDLPVVGDYDGDGYDDIALYRRSEGQWHVKSTHRNVQIAGSLPYGGDPSDLPVS